MFVLAKSSSLITSYSLLAAVSFYFKRSMGSKLCLLWRPRLLATAHNKFIQFTNQKKTIK